MRNSTIVAAALLLGGALLVPGSVDAQQSKDQQKCINKINKDGSKVQAEQGKRNIQCVKRKAFNLLGGSLVGTGAEDCINSEDAGKPKLTKKKDKTAADDTKFCAAAGVNPDFAYVGAGTVNAAAVDAELGLIHDVFSPAPIDQGLYSRDPNNVHADCQRNVVNRIGKLFQTSTALFVKCKKNALKVQKEPFPAGALSAADIEACVTDGSAQGSVASNPKGLVTKRVDNLKKTITTKCPENVGAQQPRAESFANGECSAAATGTTDDLADCLHELVNCRFCEMVNAMDGLSIDCDAFAGIACP